MKTAAFPVIAALVAVAGVWLIEASADESPPNGSDRTKKKPALTKPERAFRDTLANSVLNGRWRMVKDGELGEEREEKYTIGAVTKLGGDLWIIAARIQFADKDVTIPVPVRVKWAGDTPIISVTEAGLPGLGTYTARVMVYRNVYTGAWFGKNYGGILCGTIERTKREK